MMATVHRVRERGGEFLGLWLSLVVMVPMPMSCGPWMTGGGREYRAGGANCGGWGHCCCCCCCWIGDWHQRYSRNRFVGEIVHGLRVDWVQVGLDKLRAHFLRAPLVLLERFAAALEEANILVGVVGRAKPEVASVFFFEELATVVGVYFSFLLELEKREEGG